MAILINSVNYLTFLGRPALGVTVTAYNSSNSVVGQTITGLNGYYNLGIFNLPVGTYSIRYFGNGFSNIPSEWNTYIVYPVSDDPALNHEIVRAETEEEVLAIDIFNEQSRASGVENTLANEIPTELYQLGSDSTHRTVTDSQITLWNLGGEVITASGLISVIYPSGSTGYVPYLNKVGLFSNSPINTDGTNIGVAGAYLSERLNVLGDIKSQQRLPQALVTFEGDDGYTEQYTIAKPIFDSAGVPGVINMISSWVNGTGHLTTAQLLAMQNAGWEICSHSTDGTFLTTLTEAQIITNLSTSKSVLESLGLIVNNFVCPGDASNATVRKVGRNYYRSVRDAYTQINPYPINNYRIAGLAIDDPSQIATYKNYIDLALAQNKWMVFYYHNPGTIPSLAATLTTLIAYTQSKGIPIVTANQALDLIGNVFDYTSVNESGFFNVGVDGSFISQSGSINTLNTNSLQTNYIYNYNQTYEIDLSDSNSLTIRNYSTAVSGYGNIYLSYGNSYLETVDPVFGSSYFWSRKVGSQEVASIGASNVGSVIGLYADLYPEHLHISSTTVGNILNIWGSGGVSIGNAINDGTSLLRLGDYQVCNMFEPDLFQVSSVNDNYGYLVLYSGTAYVELDDDTNGYSSAAMYPGVVEIGVEAIDGETSCFIDIYSDNINFISNLNEDILWVWPRGGISVNNAIDDEVSALSVSNTTDVTPLSSYPPSNVSFFQLTLSGVASDSHQGVGNFTEIDNSATGLTDWLVNSHNSVYNNGNGNVTTMSNYYGKLINAGLGHIYNMVGYDLDVAENSGGGLVDSFTSYFANNQTVGTNIYSFSTYQNSGISSNTNFAFYGAGSARSWLNGGLGIGYDSKRYCDPQRINCNQYWQHYSYIRQQWRSLRTFEGRTLRLNSGSPKQRKYFFTSSKR